MIETVDDIKTIANVGTGTMGHAITLQFALAGYPVHLVGRGEASLEKAMKAIRSDAEDFAEAGLLKDGDTLDAVLARITGYADYASGVADVDFVIESVAENLDIKKSVWAEVEHAAPKDAILSTNTSGLSPTALQSVLKKPERFVVAHFWNPAQLMPLVEVVPGEKTDPKVVDITFDLMAKIGKKPAKIKKESLGFVGNRLQLAVLREAFYIVQQGIADAATVDDVIHHLGRHLFVGAVMLRQGGGLVFMLFHAGFRQHIGHVQEAADEVALGLAPGAEDGKAAELVGRVQVGVEVHADAVFIFDDGHLIVDDIGIGVEDLVAAVPARRLAVIQA